jgi:enoyl-CoA hydratase/carnithine racemase
MTDLVQLTSDNGIAIITINNPPVNALSPGVPKGISEALDQIAQNAIIVGGRLRAARFGHRHFYINGYGFPAHRGGPMRPAHALGLKQVYDRICQFHRLHGEI